MGLIRSIIGSGLSAIQDMWKEFIYCDSMDNDTLVQKGQSKGNHGAGEDYNENVITEGSKIAVNNGQVMLVVENGQIIDFTAEPGGYEFTSKTAPSAFEGNFGQGIKKTFNEMKSRFAWGGVKGVDQRAYFVNVKEIMNNKFGFGDVPYRDSEFNLTIHLQGYGVFSFKIVDPLIFYTNIAGNVEDCYTKDQLEEQIKSELQDALLPALGEMAKQGLKYDELPGNVKTLTNILKEKMTETWREKRGIEIVSMTLSNIHPDETSIAKISVLQESRAYSGNKAMLGARVGVAQANAMEIAASNTAGSMTGFAGMGIAQNAGGVNVSDLMSESAPAQPQPQKAPANAWTCECGSVNTGKFCPECGKPRPQAAFCPECGEQVTPGAKFCPNCGHKLQ